MPSLTNIFVTKVIAFSSRRKRNHRAVKNPAVLRVPRHVAFVTLWVATQHMYEQLMFHRTCNSMIGLPPRIQGDSFIANCVSYGITVSSNRKEPFTLIY